MVLHTGPEEWLLTGGSSSGREEDRVFDGSMAMAAHDHAHWTPQRPSDV
jgi:hypothetical protein